jgi:hypothetical protein
MERTCFVCFEECLPDVRCACKDRHAHPECLRRVVAGVTSHKSGCPICGSNYDRPEELVGDVEEGRGGSSSERSHVETTSGPTPRHICFQKGIAILLLFSSGVVFVYSLSKFHTYHGILSLCFLTVVTCSLVPRCPTSDSNGRTRNLLEE